MDSHTADIYLYSPQELDEFDDFYGNPDKYPIVGEIVKALSEAGFSSDATHDAGSLRRNPTYYLSSVE